MKVGDPFNPYKIFNGAYIPFSIMESTTLTSSAKLLYARLTAYAGKDGLAFPMHATLAKDLGFKSSGSVRLALKELEKSNLIEAVKASGKDRLFHKSNQYRFLWSEMLMGSLKTENEPSNPINSVDSSILRSGTQYPTPPDSSILRSGERDTALVYKDEKNHIEKNHKESTKTKKPEPLPVDPEEIVDLYHHILPELATVKVIHKKRIDQLKIIFKNWPNSCSLEWWGKYFNQVREYDFVLNGVNGNGWRANFDYFIKLEKLMMFVEKSGS